MTRLVLLGLLLALASPVHALSTDNGTDVIYISLLVILGFFILFSIACHAVCYNRWGCCCCNWADCCWKKDGRDSSEHTQLV